MALVTGGKGNVTIPATSAGAAVGLVNRWSADMQREVIDGTTFDETTNARVTLGGVYVLTGTCEGFLDATGLPVLGDMVTRDAPAIAGFVLTVAPTGGSAAATLTFDALVTSLGFAVEKTGQARFTMAFQSSGAIVIVNQAA